MIKVTARRLGKFNGPIELRVRGLPEECEVRDAVIAKGQESATVTVKLTEDTVPGSPQFEVLGLAEHEGQGRKVLVSELKLEIVPPTETQRWTTNWGPSPAPRLPPVPRRRLLCR